MTELENRLGVLRDQTVAATYLAGEAKKESETGKLFYRYALDDLKSIRAQQDVHTMILSGHSQLLDGLTSTVESTIWEKWNGIEPDGTLATAEMNS
ncbi:hypothetical protein AB0B89_32680, partial [Sphaerisporangium sp. NPDC049002]|uniref:hypothetical protein n=1 Tax=Sphaerisporangium sp. NPDC049002 TaxID=3155392 RepID=UPI0033E604DE